MTNLHDVPKDLRPACCGVPSHFQVFQTLFRNMYTSHRTKPISCTLLFGFFCLSCQSRGIVCVYVCGALHPSHSSWRLEGMLRPWARLQVVIPITRKWVKQTSEPTYKIEAKTYFIVCGPRWWSIFVLKHPFYCMWPTSRKNTDWRYTMAHHMGDNCSENITKLGLL